MSDIFIAHVEEDAEVALEIALGLEEAGYSTWCYELDGIPGPSYLLQTGQAVANSKAVVVVISPHSVGSRQVTREIVRAHESDKDFIPVRRDISHIEFQNRQPEWREAIGAATSIGVPKEGAASVLPRIIAGLKNLGIQPAAKPDSVRIEQIRKALSELLVPTKRPELEHGPAEAVGEKAKPAVSAERPVEAVKAVTNPRWFLIAGVLLCLGFITLIAGTAGYSPLTGDGPWYEYFFLGLLIISVLFIVPGAYCLRRGIAQAHVSKLAQGKISGWWWLSPIFLGPIGGMIAWLKQRDVDWRKASNLLTLGIVLSVLWTIPFLAWKASVEPTLYTLTTNISPSEAGSVSPSRGEYEYGVQVTLTASPASGYTFDHWSGSASGNTSTTTITMDSDKSLTAHFEAISTVSEVLFSDDFSNPDSGWHKLSYEDYDCGYKDGEYHILLKRDYLAIWVQNSNAGRFTDFILEIDARLVSESNEGYYGVIFRFQDNDNFYRFEIEDGYYVVGTKTGGVWTALQDWTESASIKEGHDRNHLKVVAIGPKIEVYANGHHLTTVTDDSFAEGYVGVIVETDKAGADVVFDNIDVAFDNIIVTTPCDHYNLTIASTAGGSVTTPGEGPFTYDEGTLVDLVAEAEEGYQFVNWTGNVDTIGNVNAAITTITMDDNYSITANFEATDHEVLFSDDFSNPNSGWKAYDDSDGQAIYRDGYFYMKDYTDAWYQTSVPELYFTDFVLEVETWLVDGTDHNRHMVLCRYSEDKFYVFTISGGGYYSTGKRFGGTNTFFVEPTYSPYIHQGVGAVNLIHIECIGSSLSLSVNGHLLWEGTDDYFTGGDIALAACSLAGTFTEVAFDNIKVYSLD